jgi:hypothetical protein
MQKIIITDVFNQLAARNPQHGPALLDTLTNHQADISFYAATESKGGQQVPCVAIHIDVRDMSVNLAGVEIAVNNSSNIIRELGVNVQEWLTPLDSVHPTAIGVIQRKDNFANERTDNRPSIAYVVVAKDNLQVVEFHEGKNPAHGTNGFLSEDLIAILLHRTNYHQLGPFKSRENALCATALEQAGLWLYARRVARKSAGTSGTQKV